MPAVPYYPIEYPSITRHLILAMYQYDVLISVTLFAVSSRLSCVCHMWFLLFYHIHLAMLTCAYLEMISEL